MRRLSRPMYPAPRTVRDLSDAELIRIVHEGGSDGRANATPAAQRRGDRVPGCPAHLNAAATAEWRRIAKALQQAGVLTGFDRAALAAYCQAWGRWVEAEERLRETPHLIKTPSGYVQQSPWLTIANKQLELMGRYMVELGLTPAARSRVMVDSPIASQYGASPVPQTIDLRIVDSDRNGRPASPLPDEELLARHGRS
jgi:P27 family predicted phage terminase small subunit